MYRLTSERQFPSNHKMTPDCHGQTRFGRGVFRCPRLFSSARSVWLQLKWYLGSVRSSDFRSRQVHTGPDLAPVVPPWTLNPLGGDFYAEGGTGIIDSSGSLRAFVAIVPPGSSLLAISWLVWP
jgi:hypothetical protein